VWSIGAVVFGLISNTFESPCGSTWKVPRGPFLDFPIPLPEDAEPEFVSRPDSHGGAPQGHALTGRILPRQLQYSEELRNLTRQCLAFHPDNRPTLQDLKRSLDHAFPDMKKRLIGEDTDLGLTKDDPANVSQFQMGAKHRQVIQ
jgi:hypothetical protein